MKKLQKLFALLLALCMTMSLMSMTAFAEETGTEEDPGLFVCGLEAHTHTDEDGECYAPKLICPKHVHDETCYEGETLICGETAARDLACEIDEHTHEGDCWHTHSDDCYALACELDGELECGDEGEEHQHDDSCYHAHDASCYEDEPSCGMTEGEIDDNLECETEEHTHTDELCYIDHAHGEDCYEPELICEIDEHAHELGCLSAEDQGAVADVETLLESVPSLREIQNERKNYTAKKSGSDAAAEAAYEAYVAESFAARETALEAYEALPEEMQALVSEDLDEKLVEELDTVLAEISEKIEEGHDAYTFRSVYLSGNCAYEMSSHMVTVDGSGYDIPQTLILVDADRDYTWKPSGRYAFGESNYEVLYCCDAVTGYDNGFYYKRMNLEDSTYYDAAEAAHIRSIITTSYPFVSLEEMKEMLAASGFEDAENVTRAEAIAAVQAAVWAYANSDDAGEYYYGRSFDVTKNPQWGGVVHDYSNERYDWWAVGKRAFNTDAEAGARVDALIDYLKELEGDYASRKQIVITGIEVVDMIPVQEKDGVYKVVLRVVLNNSGSSDEDNIDLIAYVGDREVGRMEVEYGTETYDLVIELEEDAEVEVVVSGTQVLPEGVYFYEPEGGRDISQSLVGVAKGETDVYAADSIEVDLDVPEVTADLMLQKVDEDGVALSGAEFALYVENGESTLHVETASVDGDGRLEVDGLLPGDYQLVETEAPAGYEKLETPITFTVDEEGNVSLTCRIRGVRGGMTDEAFVLTVMNRPEENKPPRDDDPPGKREEVIIPDSPVPLNPVPETEEPEGFTEIPEEEVPMADVPRTGDISALWLALSALSGTGLAGVSVIGRRKRDEE